MVYPIYVDGFVHVRQISSFAQAHGLKTIFDIRMSGQSPPLYHYAAYVGPAALSFLTNSSAYTTYVSFLVPFGILLTGLAAFSLAGSVWGRGRASLRRWLSLYCPMLISRASK
jgi:hypothetical protein